MTLILGDCVAAMRRMDEASFDAVVTDPPYELAFMGKSWDAQGVAFDPKTWAAALRVLKPGGHLLAFGGTRTFHRIACGIEDAGFEIRDCLMWLYGSGFPKSLDVSKAIDKAAGAEREKVQPGNQPAYQRSVGNTRPYMSDPDHKIDGPEPADDARRWQGWGTALKPAWEPVILARKPLAGTVAANVLAHGTGALNIDGCRIGTVGGGAACAGGDACHCQTNSVFGKTKHPVRREGDIGRWPANLVLDEAAGAELDAQSGIREAKPERVGVKGGNRGALGAFAGSSRDAVGTWPADPGGGASRFFYCAKASRSERGETNTHPTVKPIALMRYLVRLVTPPGGRVLDPFAGSGTTLLAAREEGLTCVGIEREVAHVVIARKRLGEPCFYCNQKDTHPAWCPDAEGDAA